MKVLAALALIFIILAQSFTDGFCGYLGNLKKWGNSIHLCGLRDASASKNGGDMSPASLAFRMCGYRPGNTDQ